MLTIKFSLLLSIMLLFSQISYTQSYQDKLFVEFGYSYNTYKMENINRYYIDSFAMKSNINLLQDFIKSGQQYYLNIGYKSFKLFDFSFYGSYQYSQLISKPMFWKTDEFGKQIKKIKGSYIFKVEAIGVGIGSTFYFNQLLGFQNQESIINRLHLGLEVKGGIGFSKVIADLQIKELPVQSKYKYFKSQDFQGQIGLKIEYDLTKNPIFTTIGLRAGYQYFKTKTVMDRLGKKWVVLDKYPINLNFSGCYMGIYLKFSK